MRFSEITETDRQLDELLPAVGAVAGGISRGATALAKGVGGTVSQAAGSAPPATAGLASGGMDPAQAAMAKKQHDAEKAQVQQQIRDTEKQLTDLRKKLAELG